MGSCASKFGLADKDDSNPPAAPDKDEFVHVIAETKLVSPIQEKSVVEQQDFGLIEGINTDIVGETRRRSVSSLLQENEGNVAVEAGGRPSEKVKPELQGSEKIISEHDEAAHHTEAGDSIPGKLVADIGGIPSENAKPELQGSEKIISEQDKVAHHTEAGDSVPGKLSEPDLTTADDGEETSEKKAQLPAEADTEEGHSNGTIITEAQTSGVSLTPKIDETERTKPEAPKLVEDGPVQVLKLPKTGETEVESSEYANNVSSISLSSAPKSQPGEADTFAEAEALSLLSVPGTTPKPQILRPEPSVYAGNAISPAIECLDTENASDAGSCVTEESNSGNSKLKTGEIVLPKKEAPLEPAAVNKSTEMQPTSAENSAAVTPEPVETKSSEKEVERLENELFTHSEVLKNETVQTPGMETKFSEEKCSDTGAENTRNQKIIDNEVGQEEHAASGVGEGGSPLLETESLLDRGDGKIHDVGTLQ